MKIENKFMQLLSNRESEVLLLLANGNLNKEIADRLNISLDTVKKHVKKIYQKMQVRNRTEAVCKFIENRIEYSSQESISLIQ